MMEDQKEQEEETKTGQEVSEPNADGDQVVNLEVKTAPIKVEATELPIRATTEDLTPAYEAPSSHPNDVKFKVKYSKDFKGEKTFADGSIQVISKESAAQFEKLGFGSVVK